MAPELRTPAPRRVTVIAHELRGFVPAGGMGTATTFLALALARMGHAVEILLGLHAPESIDSYWRTVYDRAGIGIRPAPESGEPVEPWHFVHARSIELGLRAEPPDVVIAHDHGGPAYTALRLRQAGIAFENSLFVVFCHGTMSYVLDMSRNVSVRDLRQLLAYGHLEQASVELADVVVSPSAYLLDWMRGQGWRLPERSLVIPYFTRSVATGELPPEQAPVGDGRVGRLAFFGRLDEKKGLKPFAAGLNALEPQLLHGVELEFLGKATATWPRDRIEALLSETTKRALARVSFATELDQHEALARLSRPGTLAVMPSLGDNSPNTVYECLEHGIPFIASDVGGVAELIAPEDRARVLFEPTSKGVESALTGVLSGGNVLRPARPAFERSASYERWAEVVEARPDPRARTPVVEERVDVVVHGSPPQEPSPCRLALERQSYRNFRMIVAEGASVEAARTAGLRAGSAPYVLFLDEEDVPEEELLATLVRAQQASGADIVTCALRLTTDQGERMLHFFLGEPDGLGALSNAYGTVALFRRAALGDLTTERPADDDADWPLLAGLAVAGARILSVPVPLVTRSARPGSVERNPGDALLVLERLERTLSDPLRSTARLAAGLAANSRVQPAARSGGFPRRALRRLLRGAR